MKSQDILNSLRALIEGRKRAYMQAGMVTPSSVAAAIRQLECTLPRNGSPSTSVIRYVSTHHREIEALIPRTKHYRKYRTQLLSMLRYCREQYTGGAAPESGPIQKALEDLMAQEEGPHALPK
jgi:hypothetical protein